MKKSFILFVTLSAVMVLAVYQLFIIENNQLRENLTIEQIQYTQAKYHFNFAKILIKKLNIDSSVTKKVTFDGIENYTIIATIDNNEKNTTVFLQVRSQLNERIQINQEFILN